MVTISRFLKGLLLAASLFFFLHSDAQTDTITGTVNKYAAVTLIDYCNGIIQFETTSQASQFAPGDKILIIKMRGATVSNTGKYDPNYGKVTDYQNVGACEYARVKRSFSVGIELEKALVNNYGNGILFGQVQVVKVKEGVDFTVKGNVTCKKWDGKSGGVIAISCCNLTLLNNKSVIIANGRGFRGGRQHNTIMTPANISDCSYPEKYYGFNDNLAGNKGEGIATGLDWDYPINPDPNGAGYGHYANGGGGGNNYNAGGGGGSNASAGGQGGHIFSGCYNQNPQPSSYSGEGGYALELGGNRLFMGGGGGEGHGNDNGSTAGADGGGIIIINCTNLFTNNGGEITSGGNSASQAFDDGAGGGGGGGTIYVSCNAYNGPILRCIVHGGKGGDSKDAGSPSFTFNFAPGGGGSDGVVYYSSVLAGQISTGSVANKAGKCLDINGPYGAADGGARQVVPGFEIPEGLINICRYLHPSPEIINICKNGSVTLCDSIYAESLTASWDYDGVITSENLDPVLPAWPVTPGCLPVLPAPVKKRICKTYRHIQKNTLITLRVQMPNGCICEHKYQIVVAELPVKKTVLNVPCGTEINLNLYDSCSLLPSSGWEDTISHLSNINAVVKPSEHKVYKLVHFSDSENDSCILCTVIVEINISPGTVNQKTIRACEGLPVLLDALNGCPGSLSWDWTLPNGSASTEHSSVIVPVAHNGDIYSVRSLMANGCYCITEFHIATISPQVNNITVNVYCGDSLDLDSLDPCGKYGSWYNVTSSSNMPNGKIAPAYTTTYRRRHYADVTSTNCLTCETTITVNVLPRPVKKITIYACEGEQTLLGGLFPLGCGSGHSYHWTGPDDETLPYNSSSITIVAHDGDVYRMEMVSGSGCACITEITIKVSPIPLIVKEIDIYCGDEIDLSSIEGCIGIHGPWTEAGATIPSVVVSPNTSTVYKRNTYNNSARTCLICVLEVRINVLPRPVEKDTVEGCAGEVLNIAPPCAGKGIQYHLITPVEAYVFYPPLSTIPITVDPNPVSYTIETVFPNGCICSRQVLVKVRVPQIKKKTIDVICGSTIDLNAYNLCPGGSTEWKDAAGNIISNNLTVKNEGQPKKYFGYTSNSNGCVTCITELTINSVAGPAYAKMYTIGCNEDGKYIYPDCAGAVYKWYNSNGLFKTVNGGNGQILVGRSSVPQIYTVVTVTADGCICKTNITVNTSVESPVYYSFNAGIACGGLLNLDSYTQCDNIPGTSSGWKDMTSGQTLTNTQVLARPLNHGHVYVKEVKDAYGCLVCKVTVYLSVQQNFNTVDNTKIFRVCKGTEVNPPSLCPAADHYKWYDDNGQVLLSEQQYMIAQAHMAGNFLRYNYDANGCLLCVERIYIITYEELTQQDIDGMTPVTGSVWCPGESCKDVSLSPKYTSFETGITCTWTPAVTETANGLLICPPFTDGQVYLKKCYNEAGCLFYAYKAVIDVDCQNPVPPGASHESALQYSLYPNPAENMFKIERNASEGQVSVGIYNAIGQLLETHLINDGESRVIVNTTAYSSGVYIIRINSAGKNVFTCKLIRQ